MEILNLRSIQLIGQEQFCYLQLQLDKEEIISLTKKTNLCFLLQCLLLGLLYLPFI